ncbi:MAG: sigma-70 family RNA polymerase sigma factor [Kiritimatiellia bacterium]
MNAETPVIPLDRLLAGDAEAWTGFIRQVDPVIVSVVGWRKWNFPLSLQEDVCQQIRAELPKALANFKGDASMKTFLQRVSINRCIDVVRYRAPRRNISVELDLAPGEDGDSRQPEAVDPHEEVGHQLAREELADATRAALRALGGDCEGIIGDFYLKGFKYKEIGEKRGMTIGAVCGKISRCLGLFKKICAENVVLSEYLNLSSDHQRDPS